MTLRKELERLDAAAVSGKDYGFPQDIWRRMLNVLDQLDRLGVAIADAGYMWTPEMREAYERASDYPVAGCACVACESSGIRHASDCAVHNEPAHPAGPCDCGATNPETACPDCGMWPAYDGMWHKPGCPAIDMRLGPAHD